MAESHERVRSSLDALKKLESQHETRMREAEEDAAQAADEARDAERAVRRDSYRQELARKAALEQQEAQVSAQRQAEHRQKMDSMRVTTQQQANDVEQARLYEHDAEMKALQAQEKKKVGWAPSLLAILALAGLGAGAWYGVFLPMRQNAVRETALERQRVVDENLKKREAERAKEDAERDAEQEAERLRRTKTAVTAAAAQDDQDEQTTRRPRRRSGGSRGSSSADSDESSSRDDGPSLPGDEDPLLGI